MKQKLLTLFALLLGVCSGAWADVLCTAQVPTGQTGTFNETTGITAGQTGCTLYWSGLQGGNNIVTVNTVDYYKMGSDNAYVQLKLTSGKFQVGDILKATVTANGDKTVSIKIGSTNSSTTVTVTSTTTNDISYTLTAADIEEDGSIKIYRGYSGSNLRVAKFSVSGNRGPSISTTGTKSVTATESGVAATTNIAITGSNLTANGTLTAGFTSSIEGLSVSFGANTTSIDAEGAISTTVTVSYESTVNVPSGIAYLRISDGTTTENIAITYSASVVAWELQSVSKATTWDWNKITLTISDGPLFGNQAMQLSNETNPSITDEIVYANYDGLYYTVGSGFDATTVAFTGQFPTRRNEFCQAGTVRIKAAVPGKIVVKFSDTGSSASATAVKRYLVVNGETTEYWTSREKTGDGAYAAQMNVVSGEINVPAGDVTITGSSDIVIYYITFTPTAEAISTKTDRNYASYVTTNKLAFASAEGITAYIATGLNGGGTAVELTPVDIVPASTPIIVKTETKGATVNVPVTTAEAIDVSANKLVAGDGTTVANSDYYYLASDLFHLATSGTLQSGKAYLQIPATARDLSITFGDATSIGATLKNKEIENKEVYNLKGQRVAQPTKGLYIQDGKKVIIK